MNNLHRNVLDEFVLQGIKQMLSFDLLQRNIGDLNPVCHLHTHLRKPRVLSPLRSLRVRNEMYLVPLACEDATHHNQSLC